MKHHIIVLTACSLLASCTPSQLSDEARQRRMQDSLDAIRVAQQNEVKAQLQKAREDSIAVAARAQLLAEQEAEAQAQAVKQQLIELKAQLAGEETRLRSIEDFQLLRTREEKARQVAEQVKIIESLKSQIADLEASLQ